jgi:hypothetical protein
MDGSLRFPTPRHEEIAQAAASFFEGRAKAVLVTASCARGAAVPASDLDMIALVDTEQVGDTQRSWDAFRPATLGDLTIHLDVVDGSYEPSVWDDGGGPDDFELEVGNHVAHSALMWQEGTAFSDLEQRWLPYYDEALASQRLAMVREACLRDLAFIEPYLDRGLSFQAFDRLYKALREFLQAVLIARRTYPISYTKWIRYQIEDLLGEPELYRGLPPVLEVPSIEGRGMLVNRDRLTDLVERWLV